MSHKLDVAVCKPNASSIPGRAIFIHFEVMDPETLEGTGQQHNIAMTSVDAVRLLGLLEAMSRKYNWPEAEVPEEYWIPPTQKLN
jgi:hypothetical protein